MDIELYESPEWHIPSNVELALDSMVRRLDSILLESVLTPQAFVEITAILNNASHIFLYLEAKDDHVTFTRLLPKRDLIYRNPSLDERILSKLQTVHFEDPRVEKSRIAYLDQLTEKLHTDKYDDSSEIERLKADAMRLEELVVAGQKHSLERLGLWVDGHQPSVVFYHAISRIQQPNDREKLGKLWAMCAQSQRMRIADIVDQIFEVRRRHASDIDRVASPAEVTLRKCNVDENAIATFLERFIIRALMEHKVLEEEIRTTLGLKLTLAPMTHFGYFLHQRFGQEAVPLFNFEACLDYIFTIAEKIFGLNFSLHQKSDQNVLGVDVSRRNEPVGRIHFDLRTKHERKLKASYTQGLRNGASWGNIVQLPEAWVSCKFELRNREDERVITFQDVHSLFHEFGHAINHLLIEEEIPNQSGLEYLPLERLECLSMWSEKWIYHSDFGKSLDISEAELRALELCRVVKKMEYRRTYLERAVTALLDFECHRRNDLNLRDCFDELDAKYEIADIISFSEFPQYFIWPMFMANPGANFVYLWGSAWSCEKFAPFEPLSLIDISTAEETSAGFEACFRYDIPSIAPDIDAIFSFYQTC